MEVIAQTKPDVLVGDTHLLTWILGRKAQLPVAQITRLTTHPETDSIIWWPNNFPEIDPPVSTRLFNDWLLDNRMSAIDRAGDLLRGDLYIVPSLQDIEPIKCDEKTVFVGQVSKSTDDGPALRHGSAGEYPLLYVSVGGGAGVVGNRKFFQTVVDALGGRKINVILATGSRVYADGFSSLPDNIKMSAWVPGFRVISEADAIVFHGGYATMMESLSLGKPSIVIPSQIEQEGNGRRLEHLGTGVVLKLSSENPVVVEGVWPYGKFTYFTQSRYDLTAEQLISSVDRVLNEAGYRESAMSLREKIEGYRGAAAAMERVERL
jgi:UDP:flavonoid glycosyltransferase YjiC (YdhE family)